MRAFVLLLFLGVAYAIPMLFYIPPLRFYMSGLMQTPNITSVTLCSTVCLNKTFSVYSQNIFDIDDNTLPANWTIAKAQISPTMEISFNRIQ